MRGTNSVPVRLSRLEQHRQSVDFEAQITALAERYGLHPEEVRYEAEALSRQRAVYGPEPIAATIARLAAELDLDEAELWAEYDQITVWLERR